MCEHKSNSNRISSLELAASPAKGFVGPGFSHDKRIGATRPTARGAMVRRRFLGGRSFSSDINAGARRRTARGAVSASIRCCRLTAATRHNTIPKSQRHSQISPSPTRPSLPSNFSFNSLKTNDGDTTYSTLKKAKPASIFFTQNRLRRPSASRTKGRSRFALASYTDAGTAISISGRTSIVPMRADGIRAAMLVASSRFFASMR